MFTKLENTTPYLKMALEGFAGDGKTFTSVQIAIGLHKRICSTKPIAILDTERASKALLYEFRKAGIEAVVNESRSLATLNEAIKWCEAGNADILIIDSITHIWEEFLTAYKNSKTKYKGTMTFEDWGVVKPRWKAEFSTPFVNAAVHIIFTGRAGYEYDIDVNEQGRKEIVKSGIKMKAEGETAFEPDILVLMEKSFDTLGETKKLNRVATVLKDRTNTIDGTQIINPNFESFVPAISRLLDGVFKPLPPTLLKDEFPIEDTVENKREREIIVSEIEGCFKLMRLGTGKEEQNYKASILNKILGVKSIDALRGISLNTLRDAINKINNIANKYSEMLEKWDSENYTPDLSKIKELVIKELAEDLPM